MTLTKLKGNHGFWLRVSPDEAASLIASLAEQLLSKSPNTGRREYYPVGTPYFTIAVSSEEPSNSAAGPTGWTKRVFAMEGTMTGRAHPKKRAMKWLCKCGRWNDQAQCLCGVTL